MTCQGALTGERCVPSCSWFENRNGPSPRFLVEFVPLELGYFLAALPCQCQQFNDTPVWGWHLASRDDDGGKFLVRQHPVTAAFPIA